MVIIHKKAACTCKTMTQINNYLYVMVLLGITAIINICSRFSSALYSSGELHRCNRVRTIFIH
uniref:Uncharacterized protein n=1 Tax=Arundo donax TaxID=35708 RepID=A0A0A9GJE9_ARUDO